jgi:hypothetical protein
MEMQARWNRLIEAIGRFRQAIRESRRYATVGGSADPSAVDATWDECRSALGCVLLPTAEHVLLLNRLANARRSWYRGHDGSAAWEATFSLRRARLVRATLGR